MLKRRLVLLLLINFSLLSCKNTNDNEVNPNSLKEVTQKLKSGYHEKKYPNGNLWSSCYYKNGMKHGKVATYYSNGNLRYLGHYKNDKKTGVWLFYNEDGTFAKEINFHKI